MMSIGFWEIVLLVFIVVIVFGPKKIPELARALGRANYEFKKAKTDMENESKELIETAEKASAAEEKKTENKA